MDTDNNNSNSNNNSNNSNNCNNNQYKVSDSIIINNNNNSHNDDCIKEDESSSSSSPWRYASSTKTKVLSPTSLKIQVPPPTFYIDETDKNIPVIISTNNNNINININNNNNNNNTTTKGIRSSTSFSTFPNTDTIDSGYNQKSLSDFVRRPSTSKNLPPLNNSNNNSASYPRKQTLMSKVKNVFNNNSNNNNNNNNGLIIDKNNDESIVSYKDKFTINILDTFDLRETEQIVSEHPCAYRRKVSKAGKLYITTNYFCFYSLIFNKEIKKYSDFKDVLSIKRVSSVILGSSIEITTTYKKYVFGMFENTEVAFKSLNDQYKLSLSSPISSQPKKLHPSASFEKKRNRFFSVSIQSPTKSILKESNHPIIINSNYSNGGNSATAPNTPLSIVSQNSSNNNLSTSPNNIVSSNLPPLSPLSSSPISSSFISNNNSSNYSSSNNSTTSNSSPTTPTLNSTPTRSILIQDSKLKIETRSRSGSLPTFNKNKKGTIKSNNNNGNLNYLLSPVKDKDSKIVLAAEEDQESLDSTGNNTPVGSSPSSPYLGSTPTKQILNGSHTAKPTKNRSETHRSIAFGQNILISLFSSKETISNSSNQSPPILSPRDSYNSESPLTASGNSTFINSDTFEVDPPISPRERSNTTSLVFKSFSKNKNKVNFNDQQSSSPSSPSTLSPLTTLNHSHKDSFEKINKMLITRNTRGDVQQYCFKEDVFGIPLESMRLLEEGSPYPIFLHHLINHLESTKESIEFIYLNKSNKNNNGTANGIDNSDIQLLEDEDYDDILIDINNNNNNNSSISLKNSSNNTIFNLEDLNINESNNNSNIIDDNDNQNNLINNSNNTIKKITIQSLIKLVTRGKEDAYKNLGDLVEANLLGELLIYFFKVLPNNILPDILLNDLIKGITEDYDENYKISLFRSIIFSQPQIHWTVLKSLLTHLIKLIQIEVNETLPSDISKEDSIYQEKLDIIQHKISNIFGPILFKINYDASIVVYDNALKTTLFIIKNFNKIFDSTEKDNSSYMVKKGNQIIKHATFNQILLKLLDFYYKDETFLEIVNLCHHDYFISTENYIQALISIYSQEKHREFLHSSKSNQFLEFRMKIRERSLFLIRSLIEFKPMFWSDLDVCSTSIELIQDFTEKYFDGPSAGSALPVEEFKYFQFFNDFYKRVLNLNGGYNNSSFSTTPTSSSSLSFNNYYSGFSSSVSSSQASTPPTTPSSSNIPPNPMAFSSDSIQVQRQLQNFILGASRLQANSNQESKKFNILDMDSTQVAIQITLIDEKAFRMISIFELLKKKFVRQDLSPNFHAMVQLFNRWSSWIGSEILNCSTPSQRALVIEKFIEIAAILKNLKNFHCAYAFTQGIYHYSIKRLYLTWDKINKKSMNQFEELQKIFSPESNHKNYREVLNASSPPLIPYLGLYTKDLLFAEDSNPNFITNSDIPSISFDEDEELYKSTQLINFEKLRTIHLIIKNLKFYRSNPYPMPSNAALRDRILSRPILNDDEMFDKSLLLEPRRQTQSVLPLPNLKTQQIINNINNNNNNNSNNNNSNV